MFCKSNRGFTRKGNKMSAYGTAVTIKGTTYHYIIDTKAQVRELLLGATAPIDEVVVMEETRGEPHRKMSAEEILYLVLNHPTPVEVEEEKVVVLATTSA
jgi:hypothetical protein